MRRRSSPAPASKRSDRGGNFSLASTCAVFQPDASNDVGGNVMASSHVCRRLIVLLDGTWNDADEAGPATNIVYLRELLFWGLQRRFDRGATGDREDYDKLDEGHRKKAASGLIFDGFEHVVYYGRGVGTGGLVDRLKGGVLGFGLDQDIRRAYKFLSLWFRPGDEIYIFGFSRGAFTARSLSGYLHAVGLLRCGFSTAENEKRAWDFYRTPPQDRLSGEWEHFHKPVDGNDTALVHDAEALRVRALCVFDTVGALGVPGNLFRQLNRSKYEFHDTDVNSSVDIRLHAMAIDEPRPEFVAAVWTKPKFQHFNGDISPTEQVWFPGAHGDVGGGYVQWDEPDTLGLSHLPLVWMLQRLNHHIASTDPLADTTPPQKPTIEPRRRAPIPFFGRDFFDDDGCLVLKKQIRDRFNADQHKPWELVSLLRPNNVRVINQVPVADVGRLEAKGRIQHADPIGEMIHVSAFDRLLKAIKVENKSRIYRPDNLIAAIPFVAASYLKRGQAADTPWAAIVEPIFSWQRIFVVDWDGTPLDRDKPDHVRRVFEIIPKPDTIGVTVMPPEMKKFVFPPPSPPAGASKA
jgi:uncharacterized protein (DUF2235 family)